MQYYFKWNGSNSRDYSIRLQSMPEIIKPEERVEHVIIPGRAGEMTLTEGEDIYNSYIQTIPLTVFTEEAVRQAEAWLRGEGRLTLCCQPNLYQMARVINAVTFTKHGRNSNWWDAEVQFYCNPIKHPTTGDSVEVTTSGTTVTNPGDMIAYPRITITGSGTVTVSAGGNTLIIPNCTSGWVIDSENEWILQNGVPQMNACSGSFPKLNKGNNSVTFTGASKLVIARNIRYI